MTDGMYRQILGAVLDCNWLQCMENRLDIIMYRRLLMEQLDVVKEGGDPMNVFRDPEKNALLRMPKSTRRSAPGASSDAAYRQLYHEGYYVDDVDRYCPDLDLILDLSRKTAEARQSAG